MSFAKRRRVFSCEDAQLIVGTERMLRLLLTSLKVDLRRERQRNKSSRNDRAWKLKIYRGETGEVSIQ